MSPWQEKLEALRDRSTCRITTRGRRSGRPHTVTIWFVVPEPSRLFLGTLRLGRDWPKNAAVHSDVEIEIGDLRVKGNVTRVTEEPQRSRIEAALAGKYWAAWIGGRLGLKPQGVFEVALGGEA